MPLNNNPVGKAVADYFVANAPTPGTPVTETQLEAIWQGAMGLIYGDMKTNMDVLPVSHSSVPLSNPAGQTIDVLTGAGAPGTGETSAVEPIIGTGSVQ